MTPTPHIGTGPAHRIALLVHDNGIGDHIHAMPAIWQKIRDGFEVHVYSRPFTRRCFESVGATWHAMEGPSPGWIDAHAAHYGRIYSLSQWCMTHERETEGRPTLTRFEQFAALIETTLPGDEFTWLRHFDATANAATAGQYNYIVVALEATLHQRSYPYRQSLVRLLRQEGYTVIELGGGPGRHQCATFDELTSLIYWAKLVVSVDTGPLAVALSMRIPTVALFGPSDSASVVEQFARYNYDLPTQATVIRSHTYGGCDAPCNFHAANGWQVEGKCRRIADCMAGIEPEEVLNVIRGML